MIIVGPLLLGFLGAWILYLSWGKKEKTELKILKVDATYPGDERRDPNGNYGTWLKSVCTIVDSKDGSEHRVDISRLTKAMVIGGGFKSVGLQDQAKIYVEPIDLDNYTWKDYDLEKTTVVVAKHGAHQHDFPYLRRVKATALGRVAVDLPDSPRGDYWIDREDIIAILRYHNIETV